MLCSICNGQQQMAWKTPATSHNRWLQCCKIWGLKSESSTHLKWARFLGQCTEAHQPSEPKLGCSEHENMWTCQFNNLRCCSIFLSICLLSISSKKEYYITRRTSRIDCVPCCFPSSMFQEPLPHKKLWHPETNNDCNFWHHLHDGSSCKDTPLQSVSQSFWW